MTDCPSSARNRAGQTWLSASSDSFDSCHVNSSGVGQCHTALLNPFCKAIILWLLQANHTSKGNWTIRHDIFLIVSVAAPPDRQMWMHSLNNQMYCTAELISCLCLSSFLQEGQMAFLASLQNNILLPQLACLSQAVNFFQTFQVTPLCPDQ